MMKLSERKREKRRKSILVNVVNLQNRVRIDKKYVERVAKKAVSLGSGNRQELGPGKCEVGIIFVNNSYIKRLNRKYRKVNRATDVIAFPMEEHKKFTQSLYFSSCLLGDVFISTERAKVQAKYFRHSVRKEVAILTIHGILHLLRYDHEKKEDGRVMRQKEEEILNQIEDFKK